MSLREQIKQKAKTSVEVHEEMMEPTKKYNEDLKHQYTDRDYFIDREKIRTKKWVPRDFVLGLLDEKTRQIQEIMDEDYWIANFHLNKIRERILAVLELEGDKKEEATIHRVREKIRKKEESKKE